MRLVSSPHRLRSPSSVTLQFTAIMISSTNCQAAQLVHLAECFTNIVASRRLSSEVIFYCEAAVDR
jgi:hypothetical protein